jgi:GNAT superfamily N-acetyltransferase
VTPKVHVLTVDTGLEVLLVLDEILARARYALVSPREHLEPVGERVLDTADGRLLLWAEWEGRPVGLVDARLHHPEPGALTYAQLAVAQAVRFRGVGRALVVATARAAEADVGPLMGLFAAVRPTADGALAFWSSLGFEPSTEYPELLGAVDLTA